jgi:hypothetical protein
MASRALRIALASDVALLRLRALQILVGRSVRPLDDLKIGLGDADPKIRVAAADIAVQLGDDKPDHKSVLAAMVLDALADESNPYAFRNMHAALRKMTGARIELPFGGDADPAQRAAVVKAWRERR